MNGKLECGLVHSIDLDDQCIECGLDARDVVEQWERDAVKEARADERDKIVAWLRKQAEHYPTDVFPWPSDTPEGIAANALRRYSGIWAKAVEDGEHEK